MDDPWWDKELADLNAFEAMRAETYQAVRAEALATGKWGVLVVLKDLTETPQVSAHVPFGEEHRVKESHLERFMREHPVIE
ncbi:hypothetical protein QP157_06900 [Sphingomonas sp. LR61]|uniref:hypothetical protein n=1 Tax=Sphingomonas sp. LR61 TaxID=3050234 RepID=UPI002FE18301